MLDCSSRQTANTLRAMAQGKIGHLYKTTARSASLQTPSEVLSVGKNHTLPECHKRDENCSGYCWLKRTTSEECFVCSNCGRLTEVDDRKKPGSALHVTSVYHFRLSKQNRSICERLRQRQQLFQRSKWPTNASNVRHRVSMQWLPTAPSRAILQEADDDDLASTERRIDLRISQTRLLS